MANPELTGDALKRLQEKPAKGSHWLSGRQRRAERKAHEQTEMQAARKRDLASCGGCRWPRCEFMPKKPRLEVAHVFQHRGSGGNPTGDRTRRDLLMLGCFLHHAQIDREDARVEAMTDQGTNGPLAFYVRTESGRMECVAVERSIGVSETRTA